MYLCVDRKLLRVQGIKCRIRSFEMKGGQTFCSYDRVGRLNDFIKVSREYDSRAIHSKQRRQYAVTYVQGYLSGRDRVRNILLLCGVIFTEALFKEKGILLGTPLRGEALA